MATASASAVAVPAAPAARYNPTPAERFLCASSGACVAELVTYPLEAMIIRLQLQSGYADGFVSMLRRIVAAEGPQALFRGVTPALWRQVVTGGIGVGFYPIVRKKVCGGADPRLRERILAGSMSGACAQFVASPLDVVKVRLQAQRRGTAGGHQYSGMLDAFRVIARTEGLPGYFRGVTPSLIRAASQYGAGTATYDQTKSLLLGRWQMRDAPLSHALCAGCSGFATAVAGCPADVIKTRMIAQAILGGERRYANTLDCIRQTVRNDGLRGLYKGFLPTWMRLGPWQLLFFVSFEQISIAVTGHSFPTK